MKYSRFEMLAFVLGTAAIVGSAFVPATAQVIPAEFAAQLLMIIILAGALHWGRNGGFITALIAIAIYVGMRYEVLVTEGLSVDVITMIVSRAIAYTVIGLAGAEGAAVASERLRRGVVAAIDSEDAAITARILTCGIDDEALDELAAALAPSPDPEDEEPRAPQQTGRRATDRQPDDA